MNQEQIMQIQMMEQEANQLNEQLQLIEQNVGELAELKESLKEIDAMEDGKEILANLGKRIYLPVEVKDKELIVEVGKGNLVKKNIPETLKVVESQINKLEDGKVQISNRMEELQAEMVNLISMLQKEQQKN